ncbi:MAG: hypothetical protein AAF085_15300 [Planctomycetota bacterium]
MQCNIDAKGKMLRLIYGLLMIGVGAALAGLILLDIVAGGWVWAGVVALMLFGAFGVYEARAGWCAVRAMGFKTPY